VRGKKVPAPQSAERNRPAFSKTEGRGKAADWVK
jgi:hypothetical protein